MGVEHLTQAERNALEQLLMCEAARKGDYTEYCRLVHRGGWLPGKHHLLISNTIERIMSGELTRVMFFLPPRHGKSMQISETLPSYFLGHNPDKRVIAIAYGDDLAVRFGRYNRQKVEEYGQVLFGVKVAKKAGSAKAWDIQGHRGGMMSVGLGGSITGHGADLLIIDDPIKNREEAESATMRDKVYSEYQNTARTRLHAGGAIIVIMTRWHEDDLAGRILASEEGKDWHVVSLPAVAEQGDMLGRDIGDPLWPEGGYDLDDLEDTKRTIGSYAFAALYQQRPAPLEGGLFKREWWKRYDLYDEDGKWAVPDCPTVIISVDAAFKGGSEHDYVSIQTWGKRNAFYYLIDKDKRHMDFPETLRAIRKMAKKYPEYRAIYVEDKANGPAIISILQKEQRGVIAVNPRGGKEARAHAVAPTVESGNVWIPRTGWGDDLIEEAASFPNAAHDDDVDAMTQALNRLIYHYAEVPQDIPRVEWYSDQWEDYYAASDSDREKLIEKWGNPFGR